MVSLAAVGQGQTNQSTQGIGVAYTLDALGGAGTYVCNGSGHLLRVSSEDAGHDRYASVREGPPELRKVTKISADPRLSRSLARKLAGRFGLHTSF